MSQISVIVCTHNPNSNYLERTLEGLSRQSLQMQHWDFILVDNASSTPLTDLGPLKSHPSARIVREETLGLLNARITGFRSTNAPLAVLVDDDNILAPDYLETALDIAEKWPMLGAWGGQCHPEFEETPQEWTRPYWGWIAIREFDMDRWSNLPMDSAATPCGAGMCIRRSVIDHYLANSSSHPLRRYLGRQGKNLAGGEDTDLCLASTELGLGNGQFEKLNLIHIIPARRLTEDYLTCLVDNMTFTAVILKYIRGVLPAPPPARSMRLLQWYSNLRITSRDRRFSNAIRYGTERARSVIEEYERASRPLYSATKTRE